jgi:hypothetical protein
MSQQAQPAGTPIRPTSHVHPCPRCRSAPACTAGCAVVEYGASILVGGGKRLGIGVPLTCPSCRPRLAPAEPHVLHMGALFGILDNLVTVLRAHGWADREIAQALDGRRAALMRKRGASVGERST